MIDDFKKERENMLEEINFLRETAFANKDLANAHEAKGDLFLTE